MCFFVEYYCPTRNPLIYPFIPQNNLIVILNSCPVLAGSLMKTALAILYVVLPFTFGVLLLLIENYYVI